MSNRIFTQRHLLAQTLALLLLALATAGWTQDGPAAGGDSTRDLMEAQFAEYAQRLNLSAWQLSQVDLILKSAIKERLALAGRYGLDNGSGNREELTGKEKRALQRSLKDNRKATIERMERYLDKDQMKEFKKIQDEFYDQLQDRLKQL